MRRYSLGDCFGRFHSQKYLAEIKIRDFFYIHNKWA